MIASKNLVRYIGISLMIRIVVPIKLITRVFLHNSFDVVIFIAVAAGAGGTFIALAVRKGDHQRTVADYRRTRAGAPT